MAIFFIKKIWQNETDESVHSQFIRFSRGIFQNRAVLNVNKSKTIKASGTFELANDLVNFVSGLGNVNFSGVISSKEDLNEIFLKNGVESDESKKKGLFVYIVEEVSSKTVAEIKDKIYYMLLDAEAPGISLKIKKKLSKPGKSSAEKIDDKFCILQIDEKFFPQFHEEFLFDMPENFKKARISHTFDISEIILPKGEKDFEKIRLNAKRKGIIMRSISEDGKERASKKDFSA